MPVQEAPVVIVGAGAAGLTAARVLKAARRRVLVLERSAALGGRLKTSRVGSHQFDHGFQVLLTAYPAVKRHLDLSALKVKPFRPGAHLLLPGGKRETLGDPLRDPRSLWSTLTASTASFEDRFRLLRLLRFVRQRSCSQLFEVEECSTDDYLRQWGFGESFRNNFFRPFYGGIFLERALETSNRMFLFTFKMFAEGDAVLPEGGIQAVAQQLAQGLDEEELKLNSEVIGLSAKHVSMADGTRIDAAAVIDARSPAPAVEHWLDTINVYFSVPKSQLPAKLITLVPGGCPVNNVAVVSAVQPSYARRDMLVSVTLFAPLGKSREYYVDEVRKSLRPWLGAELVAWEAVHHVEVRRALPFSQHVAWTCNPTDLLSEVGIWCAGDHVLGPSLQQAMHAGELAAAGVLETHSAA